MLGAVKEKNKRITCVCLNEKNMVDEHSKVIVTDIKIPFRSMVVLMVKWAIATIPALIILIIIASITIGIITGLLNGWNVRMWSM